MSLDSDRTIVRENRTIVRDPAARLAAFLRRQHPYKTAFAVAAETGVSAGTIDKLMRRGSMPSFANLGRLLGAYGPELLADIMTDPPEWLRDAARKGDRADREGNREAARRSGAQESNSRG